MSKGGAETYTWRQTSVVEVVADGSDVGVCDEADVGGVEDSDGIRRSAAATKSLTRLSNLIFLDLQTYQ